MHTTGTGGAKTLSWHGICMPPPCKQVRQSLIRARSQQSTDLFIILLAVVHLGGHVGVGPRAPAQQLLVGASPQLLIRARLLGLLTGKRDQPKVLEVVEAVGERG